MQTHAILVDVPLKLGKGRIEQVQDARHAIYIFEELSKVDRMSPDKSSDQIIEFAKLISKLKNKRFFDSRLRKIEEVESIDSFFIANNYIEESDARYFATLNDFWTYGNRIVRESGTRYSAALLPRIYYYNYNNSEDGVDFNFGKYDILLFIMDMGIEYRREKPMNLFWQNSLGINGYAGIIEGRINNKSSDGGDARIPNIQLEYYQKISFYPNTRTYLSLGYSAQFIQLFGEDNWENDIKAEGKGIKASTDISVNYYISPKFRLNLSSSLFYIWQESKDKAIINFDDMDESVYLLSDRNSNRNTTNYFADKELVANFSVSLIYSVF